MTHAMEVRANIQSDPAWHDLMAVESETRRQMSQDHPLARIFGVDSDAEENAVCSVYVMH